MGSILTFVMSQGGSLTIVLSVLAILVLIIFALFKAAKPYGWIMTLLGDLSGQPARPGVPARPGLMERQATTEAQLGQALEILDDHTVRLKELEPDHGESIKDHVRVTHESVVQLVHNVQRLTERVDRLDSAAATPSTTVNIHTSEGVTE
jgi:hypothetical protein